MGRAEAIWRMATRAPRVLMLDEAFVSGTVTALGLRDAGCDVYVLSAAGGRGRSHSPGLTCELLPRGVDRVAGRVRELTSSGAVDVVYPVTEPMQRLAWNAVESWRAPVFPAVSDAQRSLFGNKRRMSAAVAATGVSVPAEHDASTDADVSLGVQALGLPVVVKGSVGRGGTATVIARSEAEALSAPRRLRTQVPEVFLQQWIDGPTYLVGGVFDAGSALRLYAARKTVQHPPRTGPAAELLSVHEESLIESARRAFGAARVTGIASADFVRDAAGRFHFLELNPRPWGSMAAAAAAGVDLFTPLVALLRGTSVPACLEFEASVRVATLPLYLASAQMWRRGAVFRALGGDIPRAVGGAWRDPGLAAHLVHRCLRVVVNWRD
jgi:glutathione synthase/RimK-type ligase-like ATP-grasp enzyme